MSIVDSFKDYISTELPEFNPIWLSDEYCQVEPDFQILNRINAQLINASFKRENVMYLPDLRERTESRNKYSVKHSMRLLPQYIEADHDKSKNNEYLDKQQLETEFYKGLKKDIDKILLKAWEGKSEMS